MRCLEEMDVDAIPSHNDGFMISITDEGDHAMFTPSSTGKADLADLFRTCDMTYTAPFNSAGGQSERVLYDGRRAIFLR